MRLPVFGWLRGYDRSWTRGDVIAGLTVWAVLIPESLAYASIAGVSPVVGLYAAVPALIFYAAFGSSRQLVVGPMSATAALSAGAVGELAAQGTNQYVGLTVALALMTGLVALIAGIMRLGFLASFISEPVLKGFIIGLALTIIVGQLPKLFGVEKGEGNFFEQLWDLVTELGNTSGLTLLVGLVSLGIVLLLRQIAPMIPGSLAAVLVGILAVRIFDLDDHGVAIVGNIDSGLPSLGLPDVESARDYLDIAPAAIGVMLVGFAEGLGAAKTYAAKAHYDIDANRELIGLGAANLTSGLSSGMVVNGSLSKTAVNGAAGAKSQLSGLVVAVLTIVTLLFLTGLFEELPEATLAAVVIAAVVELVDIGALRRLARVYGGPVGKLYGVTTRVDFTAAIAALVGVLVFDTLPGLFIGIGVSLTLLLYRAAHPHVAVLGRLAALGGRFGDVARFPDGVQEPGIVVLRVEGALFFANADTIRETVRARAKEEGVRAIVLDAQTVPAIDVTAVGMLAELSEDLEREGVQLLFARDIGQVRDVLRRADDEGLTQRIYPTVEAAVEAAKAGGPPPRAS